MTEKLCQDCKHWSLETITDEGRFGNCHRFPANVIKYEHDWCEEFFRKKEHFVTFTSPGTFFPEETIKPIESWDVELATKMASSIMERYAATPHSFFFTTREGDVRTDKSCTYFLGGEILTVEQVKALNDPKNEILIFNMEHNGIDRVVINTNSWKAVIPFSEGDVVLPFGGGSANNEPAPLT